jgi:hypothetical protein
MKYTWDGIKQTNNPKMPQAARFLVGKYNTPKPNNTSATPERILIHSGWEKNGGMRGR